MFTFSVYSSVCIWECAWFELPSCVCVIRIITHTYLSHLSRPFTLYVLCICHNAKYCIFKINFLKKVLKVKHNTLPFRTPSPVTWSKCLCKSTVHVIQGCPVNCLGPMVLWYLRAAWQFVSRAQLIVKGFRCFE